MEDTKKDHPEGCRCDACQNKTCWHHGCGWGGHRHIVLRLILGVIIIVGVFWLGFHLGLIVGSLNGVYGYGLRGYSNGNMMYGYGYPAYGPGMMGGWYYRNSTSTQ